MICKKGHTYEDSKPQCQICSNKWHREYSKANPDKKKLAVWKNSLKHDFGMTIEEWQALYNKQNGRCSICQIHQSQLKSRLAVDHDHKTGMVRSLLCGKCNRGIGMFNDDPFLLQSAIAYLSTRND